MNPPDVERELTEALQVLGTGLFPDVWKGTILHAAAVVQRHCAPGSVYTEEAKRIASTLINIGADGSLGPRWDSPRENMAAILNSLLQDVRTGSLWRGIWDAKNDSCADILQQADHLLDGKYFAAAAVLAGGGLETHLKDLCQRYSVIWQNPGTITKYQTALSAEQNKGNISFFSSGDAKLVIAWGDLRNRAAHDPTSVTQEDTAAISNMIVGIRDFLIRVP
jgi:hypothetical protein